MTIQVGPSAAGWNSLSADCKMIILRDAEFAETAEDAVQAVAQPQAFHVGVCFKNWPLGNCPRHWAVAC